MTPRIITVLIFILGLGLFSYSLTLPYYKDQIAAEDLLSRAYDIDKQEYYERDAELRTDKTLFMDLGTGIAISAGIFLFFLLLTKTKTFADFKKIKTLNKLTIFVSSNLVWLLFIPGTIWYYTFRGARGDYPPFADSIVIPIVSQIPLYLFLMIPLNIFLLLTTFKASLPTMLFVKADNYKRPAILWEFFFGFCLLVNLSSFPAMILEGDHIFIFVNLFFTFVILCLRAGQISRYKHKINPELLKETLV